MEKEEIRYLRRYQKPLWIPTPSDEQQQLTLF